MARDLGDNRALAVYHNLLALTREAALGLDAHRWLYYSSYIDESDEWSGDHFSKKQQADGGLGQRMRSAFEEAFDKGYSRVVVIGSDCPEMETGVIREALDALIENDVVVGPARDGGYYLLGMSRMVDLFDEVDWSTEKVYAQTVQKISEKNLSFAELAIRSDLDTIHDLKNFKELC